MRTQKELEEERKRVGPLKLDLAFRSERRPELLNNRNGLRLLDPRTLESDFQDWARDSVIEHKLPGLRGVHIRLKLGDITSKDARQLAELVRRFSANELKVSIGQNLYLPWVREEELADLYASLKQIGLADSGVGTVADVTTCPGADTCRLGIASAKGLGTAISEAFERRLSEYRELARLLRIKISGCPNGCAQHGIADIGFHAAALSHEGRTIPAHLLFVGGRTDPGSATFARMLGKFPAKNCVDVIATLLRVYKQEKSPTEEFCEFVNRFGDSKLKEELEKWRMPKSFDADPGFYEDFGHQNESFAVRPGIKGECADKIVPETEPHIQTAREGLAQAEAYLYHKEFEHSVRAAYDAAAAAARVSLYPRLVDPFTSDEAFWEFENLFILSGQTQGAWANLSSRFRELREAETNEPNTRTMLNVAKEFVNYCEQFSQLPCTTS